MNKRQKKVFTMLKTKFKALGFNRKELESVASDIDSNLGLEEDASDEDVDEAIEKAVDSAAPFLKLVQSVSQRTIQESLKKKRNAEGDDDDDDDDDDDIQKNEDEKKSNKGGSKNRDDKSKEDDLASLIEKITKPLTEKLESLSTSINDLKGDKVNDTRRTKLEKLVKDTGAFGKSALRNFAKMTFENDDDFDDYLDEVNADLEEFNQERANKGLDRLGTPPAKKDEKAEEKPSVMEDSEIISLAGGTPETKN